MAAMMDPWSSVQAAVEATAQDESLSADARIAKLRFYRERLNDMLGRADTYIGGLELVREGRPVVHDDRVMEAREDADLREVLLERGLADEETLDALGYLSHSDLDRLAEESLLDGWLAKRQELREGAEVEEASLGEMLQKVFDAAKHPRGPHGRFSDVFGRKIAPKGRRGRVLPQPPHAPGGGGGGFVTHDEEKLNAFRGKAAEVGKFKEVHPERGMGAQVILGHARDTQEMWSWEAPRRSDVAIPEYEGPEGKIDRFYADERKVVHDKIVDLYFRQRKRVERKDEEGNVRVSWELDPQGAPIAAPAKDERTLVYLAGGTASGKSLARTDDKIAGGLPHPQDGVTIDPDEIKTLLPEYQAIKGMGDDYAAGSTHEESSDLAKRIMVEALARGVHVVLDGTGDSGEGKFPRKIENGVQMAAQAGHSYKTKVLYFDAPVEVALQREVERAQKSGRKVHEHTVRAIHAGVAANFDAVRGLYERGVIQSLAVHDTTDGLNLIGGHLGHIVPRIA